MSAPKISHNSSRNYTPWRVLFRGKSYWFKTEPEARRKASELDLGKGLLSAREIDDYLYCKRLLQGIPLLRAVRFFNEHNAATLENGRKSVAELVAMCQSRLRGRPKYVCEGKRQLGLLAGRLGKRCIADVSPNTIETYLHGFESPWSRDGALRWARYFFKWTMSPLVRARTSNPCEGFEFLNPKGSKVILSLADAEHLIRTARREFTGILPAVALQMFAGIRTEEIIRLRWHSIRRGTIRIEPEVGKMGQVRGKSVVRIIDWWPAALDAAMPSELPSSGPIALNYRSLKCALIRRCRELKPDFRWGQNALRHGYGTYGLALLQSPGRICALMGERDVDTLHNHYAECETQENGRLYFSICSAKPEPLPVSPATMRILQNLIQTVAQGGMPPSGFTAA